MMPGSWWEGGVDSKEKITEGRLENSTWAYWVKNITVNIIVTYQAVSLRSRDS